MDSSHKLDAPNNEELKNIEQIDDKSGLSTLYREPGEQFEGTILSAEEREKAKENKVSAISNTIWRSSLRIALYIAYPFVSGPLLAVALYYASVSNWANNLIVPGLAMFAIGFWLLTSFRAYSLIFKIFYKHALRTGPFLLVMLISLLASSQAFYIYVADKYATQSLLFNVALVSLFIVVYSLVLTYVLLAVWGSTRIKSGIKAAVSGVMIILSGFLVILTYWV